MGAGGVVVVLNVNESRTNWCRHHESPEPLEHRCAIGVDIGAILPRNTFGHHYAMPCNTATSPGVKKCACDKRSLFTDAEVAQQDADSETAVRGATQRLLATLPLIERIKSENSGDASGSETCPVCVTGTVHWSLCGFNNHIAMRCTTQDCIAFME